VALTLGEADTQAPCVEPDSDVASHRIAPSGAVVAAVLAGHDRGNTRAQWIVRVPSDTVRVVGGVNSSTVRSPHLLDDVVYPIEARDLLKRAELIAAPAAVREAISRLPTTSFSSRGELTAAIESLESHPASSDALSPDDERPRVADDTADRLDERGRRQGRGAPDSGTRA
jgi:hypothetical protein